MYLKNLLEKKQLTHLVSVDTTILKPCVELGIDIYFSSNCDDVELAKAACDSCSVRAQCLSEALKRSESAGVWGGQLFRDGYIIPKKRQRGRPRKDEIVEEPILSKYYCA